ncbi:MAG: hypothetical protein AVDCRST_MAG19-4490, partial [uncultured Thermomicrobiales bacterium]
APSTPRTWPPRPSGSVRLSRLAAAVEARRATRGVARASGL